MRLIGQFKLSVLLVVTRSVGLQDTSYTERTARRWVEGDEEG